MKRSSSLSSVVVASRRCGGKMGICEPDHILSAIGVGRRSHKVALKLKLKFLNLKEGNCCIIIEVTIITTESYPKKF